MLGPRERMPQHHYTGPTSTYDEAHPLLQASHHCWQTLPKSRSRQSTQQLSPNQEGNRQSIEYYAIDHLTSAKLRRQSEDRKGPLSPNSAQVIVQTQDRPGG